MKINYKNTALGLIDNPKKFGFGFPDPDITPNLSKGELLTFGYSLIEGAEYLKAMCGGNIQYVSHSFMEAFHKGKHKFKDVFDKETIEEGGVLITGGLTNGYTHMHTYYYYVKTYFNKDGQWDYELLFIDFSKHGKADECALDIYSSRDETAAKELIWNGYLREGRDDAYWHSFIISFILFKKYCDIETKVVEDNKRVNVAGKKYVNETNKRITILDSTWFTTLVKSAGFEVEGHLHWYWTGPNRSIKRLRWVATYEKEGYTRKAKILTQNDKG